MIQGAVLKYDADDVNTDVIWPGRYTYVRMSAEEMAARAMETFDPGFPAKARDRRILVVGRNFGCGSSREQASECLKHAGIRAVVAPSFARLFYRNSINLGLPVIESEAAVHAIRDGDLVHIDLREGRLTVRGRPVAFARYPDFLLQILMDGGLIEHLQRRR